MRRHFAFAIVVAFSAAAALAHHDEPPQKPAPTADAASPAAIFAFEITDDGGRPMAGRLTFVGDDGKPAKLFANADASPDDLAVRMNIAYSLSGRGAITVPPGKYTVYASCGLEWSIAKAEFTLAADQPEMFNAKLRREVDTTGWISGDFHLHTLTHSGHGDANMKERMISLIGEGLEFAVATDHNHNIDYEPTLRELNAVGRMATAVGNEVSTPIGHFNVFPLDPERKIPPPQSYDANRLFKLIRDETNKQNVVPVIQLNHPRWGGIDYFGRTELDPYTGVPAAKTYSDDYDTIEIFNENTCWGYYDDDLASSPPGGDGRHSVLLDWFNLLNRGRRYAAVGNSDSHVVQSCLGAYPRNFVKSPTDDPSAIKVENVASALRVQQVLTTTGPFVTFTVGGKSMGETATAAGGKIELALKVQAASWIDCDRVKVYVGGDLIDTIAVPDSRTPVRLESRKTYTVRRDTWLALAVEGDDPMAPIVHTQDRPVLPLALTNPVYIDADGDGNWRSPSEQAAALVREKAGASLTLAEFADEPTFRAMVTLTAAEQKHGNAGRLVMAALNDKERVVRRMAARAAELAGEPILVDALDAAGAAAQDDAYFRIACLRATKACGATDMVERVMALLDGPTRARFDRYGEDVVELLPGQFAREWLVAGYFDGSAADALASTSYGPEQRDVSGPFSGKGGKTVSWMPLKASRSGYLDLRQIDQTKDASSKAISYARTFVWSEARREVRFVAGTDDGCRVWINDQLVLEDAAAHAAAPMQHIKPATLQEGWNRVLFKVANVGGAHGLYFRVLDDAVKYAVDHE